MIVSRPKTVMNQGIPAAGSAPERRGSWSMRSEDRSATERPNVCTSSSQELRSCGTRRRHAASESRTRAISSPKRRSAICAAVCVPSADGITSARRRQLSRGSSSIRYVTVESDASPRSERTTCVIPWKLSSWSAITNWLSPCSYTGATGVGSGSARSGSPRAKSYSFTEKMSAKSLPSSSASSNEIVRWEWFETTMCSCIAWPTKRSRPMDSSSFSRSPTTGFRRKNAAE